MSDNSLNYRPSALEEQAYKEARRDFSEQTNQFAASFSSVRELEKNLANIAAKALNTAARPIDAKPAIQTEDGTLWNQGIPLLDNISLCHRQTERGVEFAIVERWPFNGTNEVVTRSSRIIDVLRTFARDQRQALKLWEEDVSAQVRENLAEKYPGHDMTRAAEGFIYRFSHPISPRQTIHTGQQQKQSGGIRL